MDCGGRGGGVIPKQRKVNLNKGVCSITTTTTTILLVNE